MTKHKYFKLPKKESAAKKASRKKKIKIKKGAKKSRTNEQKNNRIKVLRWEKKEKNLRED